MFTHSIEKKQNSCVILLYLDDLNLPFFPPPLFLFLSHFICFHKKCILFIFSMKSNIFKK